jgi:transposase
LGVLVASYLLGSGLGARSTKTERRLRQRARIVLLAANGVASRAIGRAVGCTTGTASKWRVRYAEKLLAGLDETGERGAEPKYTTATNKRILALLDQTPPEGYARWTGPLLAAALDGRRVLCAAVTFPVATSKAANKVLVPLRL